MAKIKIVNTSPPGRRSFAEDVTLDNIPENCKVYCLVYGVSDTDQTIKNDLENIGKEYGNNLFVDFWSMADERYTDVATYFSLKDLPVIVVTAESSLSSIEGSNESTFVRLDNPHLLSEFEDVKRLVRLLYNLFIQGDIADAITIAKKKSKWATMKDIITKVKNLFTDAIITIIERYGFLDVAVINNGTTLSAKFYANDNDGSIKDQFTITKSITIRK